MYTNSYAKIEMKIQPLLLANGELIHFIFEFVISISCSSLPHSLPSHISYRVSKNFALRNACPFGKSRSYTRSDLVFESNYATGFYVKAKSYHSLIVLTLIYLI
jgi:hypothetical protein